MLQVARDRAKASPSSRLAIFAAAVMISLGLGGSAAWAYSHTVGSVYHGIHRTVQGGDDEHHGWSEHDHGRKWGEVDEAQWWGDTFHCGWDGSAGHEHCSGWFDNGGRGYFYLGFDWICYGSGSANALGDGHGFCSHTHTD